MIQNIRWLGHGAFAITGPQNIFINPWRVTVTDISPDIILVSDAHYEFCSQADIKKIRKPHTRLFSNERGAMELEQCEVLRTWQTISIGKMTIRALPAYLNHADSPVKVEQGFGFLMSVNFFDIYYAGPTRSIPELSTLRPDIAIIPIDGKTTMAPLEAAQQVAKLKPKWVVPYNWGTRVDSANRIDAEMFASEVHTLTDGQTQVLINQPAY